MADFLTRLASRTLGLAPVAEPVVAPMFAPEPSLPAVAASDEALDAPQQAAEPVATRGALPPVSSPESMVRPVAPRPRPDLAEARPAPPSAGEMTSRTAMTAPDDVIVRDLPARRRLQLTPAASETVDEDALLMPVAGTQKRRAPVGAAALMTTTPAETPLAMPLPARPDSPDSSRTQSTWTEEPLAASSRLTVRQGRSTPPSWDVEPDEPLLLPLNLAEALSMRRAARAAAVVTPADEPEPSRRAEREQAAAAETPSPPPTIEVTIGRVEVRAMHPPAPVVRPKPVAPAAPRLSLEEYLRNQNGGRR